jgi:hypothetical protein
MRVPVRRQQAALYCCPGVAFRRTDRHHLMAAPRITPFRNREGWQRPMAKKTAKKVAKKKTATAKKAVKKVAKKAASAKEAPAKEKAAKKVVKKVAKKAAKRAPRKKVVKEVRLKAYWGVFNGSLKRVAVFEYADKRAAEKKAKELSGGSKGVHFIQLVKEPITE